MTIVIEGVVIKVRNSIAFVTGANRGFGLAIARELVARGAKTVYAGVRNPDGFDVPGLVPVRLDVTDEVLADEQTNAIKRSLSTPQAYYLNLELV